MNAPSNVGPAGGVPGNGTSAGGETRSGASVMGEPGSGTSPGRLDALVDRLRTRFPDNGSVGRSLDVATLTVAPDELLAVATWLRDDPSTRFAQLSDLCGVDYATYGQDEWNTETAGAASYSRAVDASSVGRLSFGAEVDLPDTGRARFVVVTHLLSLEHNVRLRLKCEAPDDEMPLVPSLTGVWNNADWYEREAFDLFGILFDGHPDLRRLLTDYGFIGHPFRKDFPLVGNVEMRYDPARGRVVYEPVSIEPRVLVPRVIRDDARYVSGDVEQEAAAAAGATASAGAGTPAGGKKSAA